MSPDHRRILVSRSAFDDLDLQLPIERGDDGRPSRSDFIEHDLPGILDRLGRDFDALMMPIANVPTIRTMIGTSPLVRSFVATVIETTDGQAYLIAIDLDLDW